MSNSLSQNTFIFFILRTQNNKVLPGKKEHQFEVRAQKLGRVQLSVSRKPFLKLRKPTYKGQTDPLKRRVSFL
jgi:hypothetical protein